MSDKVYAVVEGIIQFEPRERDANGKKVIGVAVKSNWPGQPLVNVTIWPEFQLSQPVKRGDWIAADGEFSTRTYQDGQGATKESLEISAKTLVHTPCVPRTETPVVQSQLAAPVAAAAVVVQAPEVGSTSTAALPF